MATNTTTDRETMDVFWITFLQAAFLEEENPITGMERIQMMDDRTDDSLTVTDDDLDPIVTYSNCTYSDCAGEIADDRFFECDSQSFDPADSASV